MKTLGEIPAESPQRERPRFAQPLLVVAALVLLFMIPLYAFVQSESQRMARASKMLDFHCAPAAIRGRSTE